MKIYTKAGDKGRTSLFDGTRVAKNNIRLETYGTFDELSAVLGIAASFLKSPLVGVRAGKNLVGIIEGIQKDLLDIGACLANPAEVPSKKFFLYLDERVLFFEKTIDTLTETLPALRNFIIFTGGEGASFLQFARTVARRCERRLVTLSEKESVDESFIRYFNRLSDLLFTMGRFANKGKKGKEIIWTPFR